MIFELKYLFRISIYGFLTKFNREREKKKLQFRQNKNYIIWPFGRPNYTNIIHNYCL